MALVVMLSVVLFAPVGCSRRAAAPKPKPAPTVSVPLPDWAPKNPSPEFLRAAKVLRQMGTTIPRHWEAPGAQDDLAAKAFWRHYDRTLTLAWELFGTLDEKQVDQLVSTREIRLSTKSLSKEQRDLLERYFALWRQEMKDLPERDTEWSRDWLVELYKAGARKDLSNVLLTYRVTTRGSVAMILRAVRPDGTVSYPLPAGLGELAQSRTEKEER